MQLKQPAPLQWGDTRSVLHASEQGGATPRLSRLPGTGTEGQEAAGPEHQRLSPRGGSYRNRQFHLTWERRCVSHSEGNRKGTSGSLCPFWKVQKAEQR